MEVDVSDEEDDPVSERIAESVTQELGQIAFWDTQAKGADHMPDMPETHRSCLPEPVRLGLARAAAPAGAPGGAGGALRAPPDARAVRRRAFGSSGALHVSGAWQGALGGAGGDSRGGAADEVKEERTTVQRQLQLAALVWLGDLRDVAAHPYATRLHVSAVAEKLRPGNGTYKRLRLQKLIFEYVTVRAREQGIDLSQFTFTSIQITKNLASKKHRDKHNKGSLGLMWGASATRNCHRHLVFCKLKPETPPVSSSLKHPKESQSRLEVPNLFFSAHGSLQLGAG